MQGLENRMELNSDFTETLWSNSAGYRMVIDMENIKRSINKFLFMRIHTDKVRELGHVQTFYGVVYNALDRAEYDQVHASLACLPDGDERSRVSDKQIELLEKAFDKIEKDLINERSTARKFLSRIDDPQKKELMFLDDLKIRFQILESFKPRPSG